MTNTTYTSRENIASVVGYTPSKTIRTVNSHEYLLSLHICTLHNTLHHWKIAMKHLYEATLRQEIIYIRYNYDEESHTEFLRRLDAHIFISSISPCVYPAKP